MKIPQCSTPSLLSAVGDMFISIFPVARTVESLPQWGAADAEIKVPSVENTELKRSPFKAVSYTHLTLPTSDGV